MLNFLKGAAIALGILLFFAFIFMSILADLGFRWGPGL